MNLITTLDDERLDIKKNPSFPASITGVRQAITDIMVLRDSLRATLEKIADYDKRLAYKCPTCEAWHLTPPSSLIAERDAALLAKEEALAQLCRAREQLKIACRWVARSCVTTDIERAMQEINSIPSSLCPHAEALKFALHEMAKGNRSRADWDATTEEARRRAGKEGGC
jgi:hypothetical protein